MRCNLWIYLIQFLVQIETLQIKRKKKQREARSKLRQQVNIVTAFSNFVSYIISINQSEPKDNFDFPYSQVIGKKSQLWLIFWKSEQKSFSESNRSESTFPRVVRPIALLSVEAKDMILDQSYDQNLIER